MPKMVAFEFKKDQNLLFYVCYFGLFKTFATAATSCAIDPHYRSSTALSTQTYQPYSDQSW